MCVCVCVCVCHDQTRYVTWPDMLSMCTVTAYVCAVSELDSGK